MSKVAEIAELLESHIKDAGSVEEGSNRFARQIGKFVDEGSLTIYDLPINELFSRICNRDGHITFESSAQDVAEATGTGGFLYITSKLIHKTLIAEYEKGLPDLLDMTTQVKSARKEEDIVGFGALDKVRRVEEFAPYEEGEISEKRVTIKNHKYGLIMSLSKEMVLMDQTGQIVAKASNFGDNLRNWLHRFIIEKMCDKDCDATGEDSGNSLVYGGTAYSIYANTHSTIDAQTNDNLLSGADSAFGTTAIGSAIALLRKMVDSKGEYINILPTHLIIPPELEMQAVMLLNSAQMYDTTNNAVNPYKGQFKLVVSPYITSPEWFIGAPKKQVRVQWVQKPTTESQGKDSGAAFERDVVARFKVSVYVGVGSTDYRYIVRSAGQ